MIKDGKTSVIENVFWLCRNRRIGITMVEFKFLDYGTEL